MGTFRPPQRIGARVTHQNFAGQLLDSLDLHDRARREALEGVTAATLEADQTRWTELGRAIAMLAREMAEHCRQSAYCAARPDIRLLSARLSEAVDDQFDPPAWAVIDSAARLAAREP